jgi:hypothetical protein
VIILNPNAPTVIVHDCPADRETQPDPAWFGREARFDDLALQAVGDATAAIAYSNESQVVGERHGRGDDLLGGSQGFRRLVSVAQEYLLPPADIANDSRSALLEAENGRGIDTRIGILPGISVASAQLGERGVAGVLKNRSLESWWRNDR